MVNNSKKKFTLRTKMIQHELNRAKKRKTKEPIPSQHSTYLSNLIGKTYIIRMDQKSYVI